MFFILTTLITIYLVHLAFNNGLSALFKMLNPQIPNINAKIFKDAKNWYNLSEFY